MTSKDAMDDFEHQNDPLETTNAKLDVKLRRARLSRQLHQARLRRRELPLQLLAVSLRKPGLQRF